MDDHPTARDRIWASILRHARHDDAFSISELRYDIHFDDRPSDEEIRRVLKAARKLDAIEETPSGKFRVSG